MLARACRWLVPPAVAVALAAAPAGAQAAPRTITVTGTATLQVPNDLATFRFSVETRRRSAPAALSATSAGIRRVIARMLSLGIAPGDITTGTIDVNRETRPVRPGSPTQVVEYVATNSVEVKVRDVASAGRVASAAVDAGATNVSGPSYTASDPTATERQALVAAFQDAQAKAAGLAQAVGESLGDPLHVMEGTAVSPQSNQAPAGGEAPSSGRPRVPPPVRPGTSTVTGTVTVVFEID